MRISDWSSDVCSSDLPLAIEKGLLRIETQPVTRNGTHILVQQAGLKQFANQQAHAASRVEVIHVGAAVRIDAREQRHDRRQLIEIAQIGRAPSELQSLMRISYAVFCLTKKTHIKNNRTTH